MTPPRPTWYDVLGVARDATPTQIKAAWREATDSSSRARAPASSRCSTRPPTCCSTPSAVGVRRRAGRVGAGPPTRPTSPEPDRGRRRSPTVAGPPSRGRRRPPPRGRRARPGSAPLGPASLASPGSSSRLLSLTVAVAVGGYFWFQIARATTSGRRRAEASAAAERAADRVLSYDYRHLPADRDRAARLPDRRRTRRSTRRTSTTDRHGPTGGRARPCRPRPWSRPRCSAPGVVDAESDLAQVIVFVNQARQEERRRPDRSSRTGSRCRW